MFTEYSHVLTPITELPPLSLPDTPFEPEYRATYRYLSSKAVITYYIANASAAVLNVSQAVLNLFALLPQWIGNGTTGGHTLIGINGFANIWSIHVGKKELLRSYSLNDSEGIINAEAKIGSAAFALSGVALPISYTIVKKMTLPALVIKTSLIAFSANLFFIAACLYGIKINQYDLSLCKTFEEELIEHPIEKMEEWDTLLNTTQPIDKVRLGIEQLRRRIGMSGIKVLFQHQEQIHDMANKKISDPILMQKIQHELVKQKIIYYVGAIFGLIALTAIIFGMFVTHSSLFFILPTLIGGIFSSAMGLIYNQSPDAIDEKTDQKLEISKK